VQAACPSATPAAGTALAQHASELSTGTTLCVAPAAPARAHPGRRPTAPARTRSRWGLAQFTEDTNFQRYGGVWPPKIKRKARDICMATFTGGAYVLAPGGCVNATVGDALPQQTGAAMVNCPPGPLDINLLWRMRVSFTAFVLNVVFNNPSDTVFATTLACEHDRSFNCSKTQDCVLTPLNRTCVCKSASLGYYQESPGVCKGEARGAVWGPARSNGTGIGCDGSMLTSWTSGQTPG
jgi:hypothetical protein